MFLPWIGAALAAAQPVPAPPPAPDPSAAQPGDVRATKKRDSGPGLTNLQETFSDSDYPPEAIRSGKQGATHAILNIGPDGRPIDCAIDQSSGDSSLDKVTCDRLMAKGRYPVVKGSSGKATRYLTHTTVRWVLPTMGPTPFEPHWSLAELRVDAKGAVGECHFSQGGPQMPPMDRVTCPPPVVANYARFIAGAPAAILKEGRRFFVREGFLTQAAGLDLPAVPDDAVGGRPQAVTVTIDPSGHVDSCSPFDASLPETATAGVCAAARRATFKPIAAGLGERRAVSYMMVYYRD
ncbi:energy transducer TonB [Sphingomonas sp. ASV193]|uniref:energy transducer TonB n=1 Tax=Sphingomonas sp. ASV193 TaxID=3144405 RepID=UPI0032E89CC1